MLEQKSGKKLKTLAEHKEDIERRKDAHKNESIMRKEKEGEKNRIEQEKSVRKWDNNYSSETSDVKEDGLTICYCKHCGQYSLVLDSRLERLPIRKSDGSRVVNKNTVVCKLNMVEGQTKLIKRKKGIERQYRWCCKLCGLPLCYRSAPGQSGKYTYIVEGALTDDPNEIAGSAAKKSSTASPKE